MLFTVWRSENGVGDTGDLTIIAHMFQKVNDATTLGVDKKMSQIRANTLRPYDLGTQTVTTSKPLSIVWCHAGR